MDHHSQWQEQGYLVLQNALPAAQVARLYEVCEAAFATYREIGTAAGEPFGFCYGPAGWIQLHLNHPRYHRSINGSLPSLLDAIADPLAMATVRTIFGEAPLFMQANYYSDPPGETRIGDWHRDCQFFSNGDEEVERAMVRDEAEPPRELHMHIPLLPTAASELVPGSHRRWDDDAESHIRRHDPRSDAMPNARRLQLEPGDIAFFHVNALHRGLYIQGVPRRTIAVTFSRESIVRMPTREMMIAWKGYVASYQPWLLQDGYLDGTSAAARELFERFINNYREGWKPEFLAPELGRERIDYYTNY
jgi:hypothetical protein